MNRLAESDWWSDVALSGLLGSLIATGIAVLLARRTQHDRDEDRHTELTAELRGQQQAADGGRISPETDSAVVTLRVTIPWWGFRRTAPGSSTSSRTRVPAYPRTS